MTHRPYNMEELTYLREEAVEKAKKNKLEKIGIVVNVLAWLSLPGTTILFMSYAPNPFKYGNIVGLLGCVGIGVAIVAVFFVLMWLSSVLKDEMDGW